MSKNTHALTVLATPEFVVAKNDLEKLQAAACAQVAAVSVMETDAAKAGILAGITLHRVKASMPHGEFGAFLTGTLAKSKKWTPATATKNASFYMRLALVFLDKSKLGKADLLALPGDKSQLTLEGKDLKKFGDKLKGFVGESSLTELLIKYGIKGVGLKTALEAEAAGEDDGNKLTPAQIATAAREATWQEVWNSTQMLRASLTEPERLQHLTDPAQIEQLKAEIVEINRIADDRLAALRSVKK